MTNDLGACGESTARATAETRNVGYAWATTLPVQNGNPATRPSLIDQTQEENQWQRAILA